MKKKLSLSAPFDATGKSGLYLWREAFLPHFEVLAYPEALRGDEAINVDVKEDVVQVAYDDLRLSFFKKEALHAKDARLSSYQRAMMEKNANAVLYDAEEGHLAYIDGEFWLAEVKPHKDARAFAVFVAAFLEALLDKKSVEESLQKASEKSLRANL